MRTGRDETGWGNGFWGKHAEAGSGGNLDFDMPIRL